MRTGFIMLTKAQTAQSLATAHFRMDQGISRIFRLVGPKESENSDPVKLLEINSMTPEAGILPVALGPSVAHGIVYPTVVIEITPGEFDLLEHGALQLPDGWKVEEELLPGREFIGAAS